jgi:hypothetical protein
MAGRKGQAKRLDKLIFQARQVIGLRGREAGCPGCSGPGYQRLVREGEPAVCGACGGPVDAVVISEAVVTTPQEVAEATAAALAAGRILLGPLLWAGLDDDLADQPRQVLERVEDFGEDAPAAGDGGPPRIEIVSGPEPAMSGG